MNRGSDDGEQGNGLGTLSFNEAPIHESGKSFQVHYSPRRSEVLQ